MVCAAWWRADALGPAASLPALCLCSSMGTQLLPRSALLTQTLPPQAVQPLSWEPGGPCTLPSSHALATLLKPFAETSEPHPCCHRRCCHPSLIFAISRLLSAWDRRVALDSGHPPEPKPVFSPGLGALSPLPSHSLPAACSVPAAQGLAHTSAWTSLPRELCGWCVRLLPSLCGQAPCSGRPAGSTPRLQQTVRPVRCTLHLQSSLGDVKIGPEPNDRCPQKMQRRNRRLRGEHTGGRTCGSSVQSHPHCVCLSSAGTAPQMGA